MISTGILKNAPQLKRDHHHGGKRKIALSCGNLYVKNSTQCSSVTSLTRSLAVCEPTKSAGDRF